MLTFSWSWAWSHAFAGSQARPRSLMRLSVKKPVREDLVFPADAPGGTEQSWPALRPRSRSASQVTAWLIAPQVSLILTYWPERVVVAVEPPGAQVNAPLGPAKELLAPIVMLVQGIG